MIENAKMLLPKWRQSKGGASERASSISPLAREIRVPTTDRSVSDEHRREPDDRCQRGPAPRPTTIAAQNYRQLITPPEYLRT